MHRNALSATNMGVEELEHVLISGNLRRQLTNEILKLEPTCGGDGSCLLL